MKFEIVSGAASEGDLVYIASEYSLDFVKSSNSKLDGRTGNLGAGSVSIGTLQLEVSIDSGEILFPWGLFPSARWKEQVLSKPAALPGRVILLDAPTLLKRGVSLSISTALDWETKIDRSTGWIYTGLDQSHGAAIEFATNAILILQFGTISGLWLKPTFK
ncbi:MAG TPA: hypothetical protein VNZ27_10680 [Rhodanobacter sp.]|nr:hypothetical protein [Rhodanobacter sp.]